MCDLADDANMLQSSQQVAALFETAKTQSSSASCQPVQKKPSRAQIVDPAIESTAAPSGSISCDIPSRLASYFDSAP